MDQAAAAQHESLRPVPAARDRITAAVRLEGGEGRTAPATAAAPPQLPADDGLEPVRALGGGTWLVREVRSGERFVLRLRSEPDGPERERSRSALRGLAAGLAGCDDPHVVAVRALLGPAAEPVGLVEEYLLGGSLADRLTGPGRLDPGELAAVLRDAATGLAVLHERGRCHGGVTARQILFRAPGCPAAALRPGTASGTPQDDVRQLGAVAWTALTGRAPARSVHRLPLALLRPDVPPALRRAVEEALAEDPSDRPTARELAGLLGASSEAGRGGASVAPAVPAAVRGPRRGSRRRALLLAVTAVALVAAAGVLPRALPAPEAAGTGTALDAPTPAAAARAEGPGDPRTALQELVALRGEALRSGDPRLLEQVYAPGAADAASDRATIARASAGGGDVLAGLALGTGRIVAADPGRTVPGPDAVAFVVEVRVDGYRGGPGYGPSVVARDGAWVQTVEVVLVAAEDGWRLARVEPVDPVQAVAGPHRQVQKAGD